MQTKGNRTAVKPQKVNLITLGCSKNLVDSEVLLAQLQGGGLEATHEEAGSDAGVVVINTCGFIDNAKEESVNTILDYVSRKEEGQIDKVIVTGCLSERYRDDLIEEIPEVDAWFGTQDMPDLVRELGVDYKKELVGERNPVTDGHYAYLKLQKAAIAPVHFVQYP